MKRRLIAFIFSAPCLSFGQSADVQMVETENTFNLKLQPYEPSYAVWRYAKGDDHAATAHFSFRYLLTPEACGGKLIPQRDCGWQSEAFLTYTGEFDFYLDQRPSSPVVNRVNNPGFHWRWVKGPGSWIDLGVEHRSNGQTLDVNDVDVQHQAQLAYATGNLAFFDKISRSSNFVILSGARRLSGWSSDTGHELHAKAKMYFTGSEESDIVWGPLAGRRNRFSDYDRIRLAWRHWRGADKEFSLEAVLGDRGLTTASYNLDAAWYVKPRWLSRFDGLALYVRLHSGPMLTLSNYTHSQRAIGIGLRLVPFLESHAAAIMTPANLPPAPGE